MTVRQKYYAAVVSWFGAGMVLLVLSLEITPWFVVPLVILMIIFGSYTMSLKCWRCGHPVLRGRPGVFWYVQAWIPAQCVSCGAQLK